MTPHGGKSKKLTRSSTRDASISFGTLSLLPRRRFLCFPRIFSFCGARRCFCNTTNTSSTTLFALSVPFVAATHGEKMEKAKKKKIHDSLSLTIASSLVSVRTFASKITKQSKKILYLFWRGAFLIPEDDEGPFVVFLCVRCFRVACG